MDLKETHYKLGKYPLKSKNLRTPPSFAGFPSPASHHLIWSVVGHARTEAGRLQPEDLLSAVRSIGLCSLQTTFPWGRGSDRGFPTSNPAFGAWQHPTYHDFGTFSTPLFESAEKRCRSASNRLHGQRRYFGWWAPKALFKQVIDGQPGPIANEAQVSHLLRFGTLSAVW